jgi:hypothetical protein
MWIWKCIHLLNPGKVCTEYMGILKRINYNFNICYIRVNFEHLRRGKHKIGRSFFRMRCWPHRLGVSGECREYSKCTYNANIAMGSQNHCCDRKATMLSVCIIETHITANTKILTDGQKSSSGEFMSPATVTHTCGFKSNVRYFCHIFSKLEFLDRFS